MWVWVLENLFQEVVQGLFFHHLAGSGRQKKTREIDQEIFYMFGIWVEEMCARDPFRDWCSTIWPDPAPR